MIDLPTTPRFLITRLSAIGDCVHTMPLVAALRTQFPRAYIAWVTQNAGAQVIDGLAGLDEVVVVDRNWMKRPSSIFATRNKLRSLSIDVSIDPQSLTKSSLLGWLSGARHRIGFEKGQARELSPWLSTTRVSAKSEHVVDRYLELLQPLGISESARQSSVQFNVPTRPHAASAIQDFLKTISREDFALLNPGAGWNSKLWPHERYAQVATHLKAKHNMHSIVLWAGDRERKWAEAIVSLAPDSTTLAPDTSLQELAELCRTSRLFVGSDTGPLHLAAAVGTSCVSMFGPTKPSVCGPYATTEPTPHEALQVRFQDGTSKQRRGNDNSAMSEISVEMVTSACDRVLERHKNRQKIQAFNRKKTRVA